MSPLGPNHQMELWRTRVTLASNAAASGKYLMDYRLYKRRMSSHAEIDVYWSIWPKGVVADREALWRVTRLILASPSMTWILESRDFGLSIKVSAVRHLKTYTRPRCLSKAASFEHPNGLSTLALDPPSP